ncbi:unnamed protein product [Amoebophrya sp. A120]|nr:unnamed protein product [Amoebophrya sp. A120]|eukprot:GSA120T00001137001.1
MKCQLHLLVKDDNFVPGPETATPSTASTSATKFRSGGPCDHFVGAQAGRFWAGRSNITAARWTGGGRVVCTEQPNVGREAASFANYTYEKYDEIQALYPLRSSPSQQLEPSAITVDKEQDLSLDRSASASPYLRLHYLPFPCFNQHKERINTIRNAFRQDPLSVGKPRAYFNHYNFPSAHREPVGYLADNGYFFIAEYNGHKMAPARFRPDASLNGTATSSLFSSAAATGPGPLGTTTARPFRGDSRTSGTPTTFLTWLRNMSPSWAPVAGPMTVLATHLEAWYQKFWNRNHQWPMNLRSWYESWIREPAWEEAGTYFSGMNGAQSTTSVLLLQRKKELYREVGQECSTGDSFGNECGHFVERLMPVIFGYGAENKATEYKNTTSLENELPNIKTRAAAPASLPETEVVKAAPPRGRSMLLEALETGFSYVFAGLFLR